MVVYPTRQEFRVIPGPPSSTHPNALRHTRLLTIELSTRNCACISIDVVPTYRCDRVHWLGCACVQAWCAIWGRLDGHYLFTDELPGLCILHAEFEAHVLETDWNGWFKLEIICIAVSQREMIRTGYSCTWKQLYLSLSAL